MSSQLANLSGTLPPVGTPAVVPGSAAGVSVAPPAPPVPADDPAVVALLQQILSIVTQLLAVQTAQAGAAGITAPAGPGASTGGGSGSTHGPASIPAGPRTPNVVSLESLSAAAAGGSLGGGAAWSGAYTIHASSSGVTGGGPAPGLGLGSSSVGGTSDGGFSITAGGADAASPTSVGAQAGPAAPVTVGGGAAVPAAQVDMRRLLGTPRPGDVIDVVLRSAAATAAPARSDGSYLLLVDGNGAQLQAHVHGTWAARPDQVLAGIQQGLLQVHVHTDGTIHLHDVG